ncbi:MAG: hypothetical protein OXR68_04935, partial [Alphaproteobacteria bacterium]|nr:hypothetical protein [Alphaproteobacteria bacterium]
RVRVLYTKKGKIKFIYFPDLSKMPKEYAPYGFYYPLRKVYLVLYALLWGLPPLVLVVIAPIVSCETGRAVSCGSGGKEMVFLIVLACFYFTAFVLPIVVYRVVKVFIIFYKKEIIKNVE